MGTSIENLVNSGDISIETILSEAKEVSKDYWVHPSGLIISTVKGTPKLLKLSGGGKKGQYRKVRIRYGDCSKDKYVHRLVAEAFIDNKNGKKQVNHINGNTADNRVENLEWVTHKENMEHSSKTGLVSRGSSRHNARFNEETVKLCFEMYIKGVTPRRLSEIFNIPLRTVSDVVYCKTWRHITEPLERATTIPNGSTQ